MHRAHHLSQHTEHMTVALMKYQTAAKKNSYLLQRSTAHKVAIHSVLSFITFIFDQKKTIPSFFHKFRLPSPLRVIAPHMISGRSILHLVHFILISSSQYFLSINARSMKCAHDRLQYALKMSKTTQMWKDCTTF